MKDNREGWKIVFRQCLLETPAFDVYEEKSICPHKWKSW